jgi:hypothetical protein
MLYNGFVARAQRTYMANSVLQQGNWYKFKVSASGVYKLDIAALQAAGVATSNITSNSIRIYSNMGTMLAENNAAPYIDDLQELAIDVQDGGDGILNGSDAIYFYIEGTQYQIPSTGSTSYNTIQNLYGSSTFIYFTIGGNGLRIVNDVTFATAQTNSNNYNASYYHKSKDINWLHSGKLFVSQPLSNAPGRSPQLSMHTNLRNWIAGQPAQFIAKAHGRVLGNGTIQWRQGSTIIGSSSITPISGNVLDLYSTPSNLQTTYTPSSATQPIVAEIQNAGSTGQAWIDEWEVHYRGQLSLGSEQLVFADFHSVHPSNVVQYNITNTGTQTIVWDISNVHRPKKQTVISLSGTASFKQTAAAVKQYIAFDYGMVSAPTYVGTVPNQNLHGGSSVQYIVIAPRNWLSEAQRLVSFHQLRDNITGRAVAVEQIFEEFGAGIPDVSAIRNFLKMYYDKYNGTSAALQNVLLLGDATYDYTSAPPTDAAWIPTWQSANSNNPLTSYCTDDFFGYLADNADINNYNITNLLQIGIGRVPAKSKTEASAYIDKVLQYHNPTISLGSWRNNITFVADDEDGNLHLNDAEILSATVQNNSEGFSTRKIYLDAFQQESQSGGSRYPAVNVAVNNAIHQGTLIWNYSGHGGSSRLAEEAIMDETMLNNWTNSGKLPLFITATCDFAPFDNPSETSIGEKIVLKPNAAAIALMTTTRVVFAYSNRIINNNYLRIALERINNRYRNLGQANKDAKNYTVLTAGDVINVRKFTLLGDPYTTLAFPTYHVKTNQINNKPYTITVDTLRAAELVTISGGVYDGQVLLTNFTGKVNVIVSDKVQTITTKANDPTSQATNVHINGQVLYRGTATVTNGLFTVQFVVPKDIQYNIGQGSIHYYAYTNEIDANGTNFMAVGDNAKQPIFDTKGPDIQLFINNTSFKNYGITNDEPALLVYLFDSSGINLSSSAVGHDIMATLDGDSRKFFVLNEYYIAENDTYQLGTVYFQMPKLSDGKHFIDVQAWDVLNNSSIKRINFEVKSGKLLVEKIQNYPNPMRTNTVFTFEHNAAIGSELKIEIDIFQTDGLKIKTLKRTIISNGSRFMELQWDGKGENGIPVRKGIFFYRVLIINQKGEKIIKTQKLIKF